MYHSGTNMVVPYIQCNSGLHTVRLFNVCCQPCPDQKEYIPAMMLCFYSLSSRVCVYLSSNHKLSKQYKGKFICINNPQSLCLPKQSISRCQSNQFMITPGNPLLNANLQSCPTNSSHMHTILVMLVTLPHPLIQTNSSHPPRFVRAVHEQIKLCPSCKLLCLLYVSLRSMTLSVNQHPYDSCKQQQCPTHSTRCA